MAGKISLSQIEPCDLEHAYVFISYSSKDEPTVYRDVFELQKRGYNVWLDELNLDKTKPSWKDDAISAVEGFNCRFIIFYVSRHSLVSANCLHEMQASESIASKRHHRGRPVQFICVEVEEIDNISKFANRLYDDIDRSDMTVSEKETASEVLSIFVDEIFNSNNERVRLHPKDQPGRRTDYYDDIVSSLSKALEPRTLSSKTAESHKTPPPYNEHPQPQNRTERKPSNKASSNVQMRQHEQSRQDSTPPAFGSFFKEGYDPNAWTKEQRIKALETLNFSAMSLSEIMNLCFPAPDNETAEEKALRCKRIDETIAMLEAELARRNANQ